LDLRVIVWILLEVCKHLKTSLDRDWALCVGLLICISCDIIPGIRVDVTLEAQDWCRGRIGTLDPVGVLDPHPAGQHATIRTAANNHSSIHDVLTLLDKFEQINVVKHGLLSSQLIVMSFVGQ